MSNKKHMSSSKIMSSQLKKHTLKTHEQQMTTWEMQQSWVSLLKPPKKWAGNKHMRNSKVMSSLEKNKSWATKTKIMRISRVMSSLYQKKTKHFWEPINNMRNSKGMSSLTKKTKNTWAGNQTLRNSKVMSSLFDKKHIKNSWATNDNMGNSKGMSSLTAKHTWAGNRKNEKLKSHE